jgi:hypothetical protein
VDRTVVVEKTALSLWEKGDREVVGEGRRK